MGIPMLERCLKSIEKQTFDDFEIIISDDSSDDKIQKFCDEYEYEVFYYKNTAEKEAGELAEKLGNQK